MVEGDFRLRPAELRARCVTASLRDREDVYVSENLLIYYYEKGVPTP